MKAWRLQQEAARGRRLAAGYCRSRSRLARAPRPRGARRAGGLAPAAGLAAPGPECGQKRDQDGGLLLIGSRPRPRAKSVAPRQRKRLMATLSTSEEVVGALRQAVAHQSRGPRHIVDAYLNLLSSDPLLHIRIRELRERAFATARRRPPQHHPHPRAPAQPTIEPSPEPDRQSDRQSDREDDPEAEPNPITPSAAGGRAATTMNDIAHMVTRPGQYVWRIRKRRAWGKPAFQKLFENSAGCCIWPDI